MTNAKRTTLLTALVLFGMAVSGCMGLSEDDRQDGQDGTGSVAFYVKDAPVDELDAFYVTFTKVEVHMAGGDNESDADEDNDTEPADNDTEPADNDTEPAGNDTEPAGNDTEPADNDTASPQDVDEDDDRASWITIVNETQTVDLLQFQGDARAFLGNASLESGKYTQIRIHIDEAWGESNGTRINASIPSDALKIVRPWDVENGTVTELTVDFVLERSLMETGKGDLIFKPVLKLSISMETPEQAEENAQQGAPDAAGSGAGGPPEGKGNESAAQGGRPSETPPA